MAAKDLSLETIKATIKAMEKALPVLESKGMIKHAAELSIRLEKYKAMVHGK